MLRSRIFIAAIGLTAGTAVLAQDYFDFGEIPGVPDTPAVQLDLTPMILNLASQTTRLENPAVADLLDGIDGVRVRVYNSLDDVDAVAGFIDGISDRLLRDDWEQIVAVDDGEKVRVFVRGDDQSITGATAMIVAKAEAVFVSVAGSISAQQLADTVAALDSDGLLGSLGQFNLGAGFPIEGLASQNEQ